MCLYLLGLCSQTTLQTDPWWVLDFGADTVVTSLYITAPASGGKQFVLFRAKFGHTVVCPLNSCRYWTINKFYHYQTVSKTE